MAADRLEGSPMPEAPKVAKALIMPVTVPNNPIMGVHTPMTDRYEIWVCILESSFASSAKMPSSTASLPSPIRLIATRHTLAKGDGWSRQ